MTYFKIYKSKDGFYSVLFKVNNRIEFFGAKNKNKNDCFRTINLIKHLSSFEKAIKIERIECGSWIFYLVNLSTGKKIGVSQTYISKDMLFRKLTAFKSEVYESKIDSELYSM